MSVFTKIRWWVYESVNRYFTWAVEVSACHYQTFFAIGPKRARKIADRRFGKDAYLLNRDWM